MSIARVDVTLSRSFRTLMCQKSRCLYIKVLQTFRLRDTRFSIDMQVLTDLKRRLSRVRAFRK